MAAVDSRTVFFARIAELGMNDLNNKFEEKGWTMFVEFAFATSSFKEPDADTFATEVIVPLLGSKDKPMAP